MGEEEFRYCKMMTGKGSLLTGDISLTIEQQGLELVEWMDSKMMKAQIHLEFLYLKCRMFLEACFFFLLLSLSFWALAYPESHCSQSFSFGAQTYHYSNGFLSNILEYRLQR